MLFSTNGVSIVLLKASQPFSKLNASAVSHEKNRWLSETARSLNLNIDSRGSLRLHEFLAKCDYVVIAAALAPGTERLIGARQFAAMKPSAVLVNVGRGQICDEDALWAALKEKRIRGATLDVWYAYPRHDDMNVAPSKHPFHELDNVWMTPHIAAWTTGMVDRRWSEIARNLDSLARGEPLLHQLR